LDFSSEKMMAWNPRYVAYATAHGKTPGEMLSADEAEFPGGRMTGFVLWMRRKWAEWGRAPGHGDRFPGSRVARQEAHDDFDRWLSA